MVSTRKGCSCNLILWPALRSSEEGRSTSKISKRIVGRGGVGGVICHLGFRRVYHQRVIRHTHRGFLGFLRRVGETIIGAPTPRRWNKFYRDCLNEKLAIVRVGRPARADSRT